MQSNKETRKLNTLTLLEGEWFDKYIIDDMEKLFPYDLPLTSIYQNYSNNQIILGFGVLHPYK